MRRSRRYEWGYRKKKSYESLAIYDSSHRIACIRYLDDLSYRFFRYARLGEIFTFKLRSI